MRILYRAPDSLGLGLNFTGKEEHSQPSPLGESQIGAFFLLSHFRGGRGNTEKCMLELQGKTEYSLPEEHRTHL